MAKQEPQAEAPVEREDAPRDEEARGRGARLSRLARRLMDPRELSGDARELVGAVLESSDRAKTEMVRMVAREARNYLEELRLEEGIRALVTGHSLEVHVSLSLKPLAAGETAAVDASARAGSRSGAQAERGGADDARPDEGGTRGG